MNIRNRIIYCFEENVMILNLKIQKKEEKMNKLKYYKIVT